MILLFAMLAGITSQPQTISLCTFNPASQMVTLPFVQGSYEQTMNFQLPPGQSQCFIPKARPDVRWMTALDPTAGTVETASGSVLIRFEFGTNSMTQPRNGELYLDDAFSFAVQQDAYPTTPCIFHPLKGGARIFSQAEEYFTPNILISPGSQGCVIAAPVTNVDWLTVDFPTVPTAYGTNHQEYEFYIQFSAVQNTGPARVGVISIMNGITITILQDAGN